MDSEEQPSPEPSAKPESINGANFVITDQRPALPHQEGFNVVPVVDTVQAYFGSEFVHRPKTPNTAQLTPPKGYIRRTLNQSTNVSVDGVVASDILKDATKTVAKIRFAHISQSA